MKTDLSGFLGLCRRANKMTVGHDAVVTSIKSGNSKLCIICSDASGRLKKEISEECGFNGRSIKFVDAPFTMSELSFAIGKKVGVISVDEEGFANKLYSMIQEACKNGD